MTSQTLGDKKDFLATHVRNSEASATIPKGAPVILKMNGTEDGFAVVLPSSSSASKIAMFYYGVAMDDILAGQIGNVQREGVCNYIKIELQTRANTSGGSSFSTADTLLLGALLGIDSAGNCFKTVASTVAAPSNADQTLTLNNQAFGALGQSVNSQAGIATSTSETRLTVTTNVKAMLRLM